LNTSLIKILSLTSFVFACFTTQLNSQTKIPKYVGEQLHYRMEFLNLPAGSIDFNIVAVEQIDSSNAYHLIVNAQTNSLFSSLFRVKNKYESFFDSSTFLPLILSKDIKQKNINHQLTINFDQNKNIASIADSTYWSIPDLCYSFFSMLYFLRRQNFVEDDTIKFNLDSENLPSEGTATFANKKVISTPAGRFKAIEIKLSFKPLISVRRPWKTDLITNRMANPNSKMKIWLSDDEYRLPLIIQFNQKRSKVKLVLKQFKLAQTN